MVFISDADWLSLLRFEVRYLSYIRICDDRVVSVVVKVRERGFAI